MPVWNEDLDNLNKAEFYLKNARDLAGLSEPVRAIPDYRAAGVYARTAFEMALKRFFHKHEVPVAYQLEPKHMLGDLWPVMEKLHSTIGEVRGSILSAELCRDIETYTKSNLNPLCHSGFFQYDRCEVLGAVAAVGQLQDELAKPHKKVGVPVVESAPTTDLQTGNLGFDLRTVNLSELEQSELIRFKDNIASELRNRAKN